MGLGKRKPRLGLLTSFFPKLTSRFRTDSRSSSVDIYRKPVPGSSTSSYTLPTSTASTTAMDTSRTSEASESSSRFESGTASTPLSPIDQVSPLTENGSFVSSPPKKLQKAPAMPSAPPPPPPSLLQKPSTPPRVPAVTATQPTPGRSHSPERPPSRSKLQASRLQPRHPSPAPNPRGRSVSAQPPIARGVPADGARAVSNPLNSHPQSRSPIDSSPPSTSEKRKSRMSWFPGGRSRGNSDASKPRGSGAWLMTPDSQLDYNTTPLVNGEKVPELWNESGNVFVYLYPKGSGRGPSFKVADHVLSPSAVLNELLVTEMMAATSHTASSSYLDVTPPAAGPVTEGHLYLPLANTDAQCLVAVRNLFALLTHQPLVGTAEAPTYFAAILQIAGLLRQFNFSSYDGSSFGESVDAAFDLFMGQVGLGDVRHSREKTLEALILGEQMRSWTLYNEAFVHAVGKYDLLLDLKSPLFERISVSTRKRLDRAHLDLTNRQANVNTRLESFEFPSLFSGIASSTSTEEYKSVKFKEWRNSFGKMRSFILSYYKGLFGNWPPRARSRKNYFSQSGLNRQCLKILYSDFCALYDLLVDRQSVTPRVIGEGYDEPSEDVKDKKNTEDASISALRRILSEFDKSSPPVLPPIPFDVPKLPSMTAIYENYHELPAKKQTKYSKALQPHELQLLLIKSRNIDTDSLQMPVLLAFKEFELREARGTNPQDLADQRIGYWLFLYVVLQSLPMLVVDAPGLRHTEGVEDFLCEAPQGNPPWTEDAGEVRKMWYQTADQNIVELSADVVMFSVEGIYMRSHCWLAAKEWEALGPLAAGAALPPSQHSHPSLPPSVIGAPGTTITNMPTSPLQPPRPIFHDMDPFTSGPPSSSSPTAPPPHGHPHHHPSNSRSGSPASGSPLNSTANSPHLRPRSGSHNLHANTITNDRARQALRASIAIGLEPLPMNMNMNMNAPGLDSRASRVLLGSSGSVPSVPSLPATPGERAALGSPGAGAGLGAGVGLGGGGDVYQRGLRASRSAANLSYFNNSPDVGNEFLAAGTGVGVGGQPRKSSYGGVAGGGPAAGSRPAAGDGPAVGGGPAAGGAAAGGAAAGGHAASESLGGGSTFDDILKGMDGHEKKAKKKLFF